MSPSSIDNHVFEVLATAGDTRLDNEDFDNRVTVHFGDEDEAPTCAKFEEPNIMSSRFLRTPT